MEAKPRVLETHRGDTEFPGVSPGWQPHKKSPHATKAWGD